MALVLTHPDYATNPSLLRAWSRLLDEFRDDDTVWQALPREVACWWRRRAASVIRETDGGWRVEGPAAGEARIRTATPPTRSAHVLASPVTFESPRSGSDRSTAPHVLIVVENVALGEDHRVRKQVQDLLTAGYRVSVVTKSDPANEAYYKRPGLTVLEYPAPPEPESMLGYVREYAVSFAWAALLSIRARLGDRFDVLQLCQPPDIYFPIARLLGAAVLVDQRDLMPELLALRQERPLPAITSFLRWLERRTQRVADEAICTNEYQKARLVAAGAAPNRVTLVLNGPVHDRVLGTAPDASLRSEFSFLCCWIGKMGRQDRVDLALRTVEHVVNDLGRKDVGFVFLGNGECLEEAQALSTQLGLDPWVSFNGWVPESTVFTHLATADLGIDASLQGDVSPVKIFEYMAFGVAFVSFDLAETRTIGTGAGLFAPSGDVPALARALVALLDDPDQRAELGRVGRDRVRDELAWEHQATRYLTVVDRLVRRGRRPSRCLSTAEALRAIEDAEALS
jgi:glycosyltransferase involved in cell wall biosynthesis